MDEVEFVVGGYYKFWYVNHNGIRKQYECELLKVRFGTSKYYDTPRVLFDMRKVTHDFTEALRTFDPRKIEGPVEST